VSTFEYLFTHFPAAAIFTVVGVLIQQWWKIINPAAVHRLYWHCTPGNYFIPSTVYYARLNNNDDYDYYSSWPNNIRIYTVPTTWSWGGSNAM